MIICFDCSSPTKAALDDLLGSGGYRDYTEAINVAIMNLSVMSREAAKSGVLLLKDPTFRDWIAPRGGLDRASGEATASESVSPRAAPAVQDTMSLLRRPEEDGAVDIVARPGDVWARGAVVPLDRWVFGQYNRMLPAKVSCRGLANVLRANRGVIDVEEASRQISREALRLGDLLRRHDEENETDRDGALGVAFPKDGENLPKSLLRYATQFVCSVSSAGRLSGLPYELKLVNSPGGKVPRLSLTEAGLEFARMWNPVLDGERDGWHRRFSEEEIQFLLGHIALWVPAEASAYLALGRLVLEGVNTPNALDEALVGELRMPSSSEVSSSFVSTQRSGAVSRMTDLGLMSRIRDGARVIYKVTDSGREYFARLEREN